VDFVRLGLGTRRLPYWPRSRLREVALQQTAERLTKRSNSLTYHQVVKFDCFALDLGAGWEVRPDGLLEPLALLVGALPDLADHDSVWNCESTVHHEARLLLEGLDQGR